MNYAFNRIKFNRQVVSCIAKYGKKKYVNNHNKNIIRRYSNEVPENQPSWKLLAFVCGLGLYHHYKRDVKYYHPFYFYW